MKLFLIDFLNYFYNNYIIEDWTDWTRTGKRFIYPFWFIRSIIYWCLSLLLLIVYGFKQLSFVKQLEKNIEEFDNIYNFDLNQNLKDFNDKLNKY